MISTLYSLISLAVIVGVLPIRLVDAAPQKSAVFADPDDYYAILGLTKACIPKEIKSSRRKLALQYHPDKVQDEAQKADAHSKFLLIEQAYTVLSDPEERKIYDTSFKSGFDQDASETETAQDPSGFQSSSSYAAAFASLEQFLTAVKTEPVAFGVGSVCFIGIWEWFLGEWALNTLTFSIFASLRLVWWAIRNILDLVCMAFVAVIFASLRLVWWAIRNVLALVWMAFDLRCGHFCKLAIGLVGNSQRLGLGVDGHRCGLSRR
jgi:DnaJ domain